MRIRGRSEDEAINAGEGSRFSLFADALWTAQDRGRTGLARALRWLAWMVRSWIVWPARDWAEAATPATRALGIGALVLIAAGAGVAALLWVAPSRGGKQAAVAEAAAPVAQPAEQAPAAKPEPQPTLHGAAPDFGSGGVGADGIAATGGAGAGSGAQAGASGDGTGAQVGARDSSDSGTTSGSSANGTGSAGADVGGQATGGDGEEAASSRPSSDAAAAAADPAEAGKPARGPVAGRQAVAVAREFATAFVSYEIGDANDPAVQKALAATATPELSQALLQRPPRLPANVKVPKAKVLNVVPAPSRDGVFPISVSLLRVGTTSELRLEMEKPKGKRWRVTNVLG